MTVAIGDPKPKLKPGAIIPPGDIQAVEDFFDANKEAHLKEASLDLGMSVGKIWFILISVEKKKATFQVYFAQMWTISECVTNAHKLITIEFI